MARVHCPDCEMAVVVDPNGVCPEGHLIGNAGNRIEMAIGEGDPHPDEPEPWSAVIAAAESAEKAVGADAPRAIRPIAVGPEEDEDGSADNDAMLQELHALSDVQAGVPDAAPTAEPTPVSEDVPPPPPAQAAAPEPDTAEVSPEPAATSETPPPTPRRSAEDLDAIAELAALFDAAPRPTTEAAPPADTAPRSTSDDEHDEERPLATVSHLPSASSAGATGAAPADGQPEATSDGNSIDWSHFTARGKRRRFGR